MKMYTDCGLRKVDKDMGSGDYLVCVSKYVRLERKKMRERETGKKMEGEGRAIGFASRDQAISLIKEALSVGCEYYAGRVMFHKYQWQESPWMSSKSFISCVRINLFSVSLHIMHCIVSSHAN